MIISKEKAKEWANDILQKRKRVNELLINEPISWNEKVGHTAHLTSADRNQNGYLEKKIYYNNKR